MYSSVHLCTTVCIYVQQCASMHNSVYLCTAVCIYAQQCVSMYSSVYLCMAVVLNLSEPHVTQHGLKVTAGKTNAKCHYH